MKPVTEFRGHETSSDYKKKQWDNNQKKNYNEMKEGVIINSFIKDGNFCDSNNKFFIPQSTVSTEDLFEKQKNRTLKEKVLSHPLTPLCVTTLGVLGGVAVVTKLLHQSSKIKLALPEWKHLPEIARNMNLVSENQFVTYVMLQNPSVKTAIAALATFAFTSGVFVMKSFVDGFKEVWVKKQEAGIQKNLQENLIAVETKSFAGKNQIVRNMMNEKNAEMSKIIKLVQNRKYEMPSVFKGFGISFGNSNTEPQKEKKPESLSSNLMYFASGILTLGLSVFLIKKTHGYIKNTAKEIEQYEQKLLKKVENILAKDSKEILSNHKAEVQHIFEKLNFKPEFAKEQLLKAGLKKEEIEPIVERLEERVKRFVQAPESIGGRRGIQYYSYIDDVQGHFYNWIMNRDSKSAGALTRNLFIALATVTGIGYLGKTSVEAIKDVQVKKVNANTELDLHKQLVNVELKNFSSKKNSIIQPLVNEFKQKATHSSDAESLKVMANDVLFEIKNSAPFVYS
jgi:hypothetical protein